MTEERPVLTALLIDDEPEDLEQLLEWLPKEQDGFILEWEGCNSFDEGIDRLKKYRYDIITTDVYLGKFEKKNNRAQHILTKIQSTRFCPVLVISAGPPPDNLETSPFVAFASKATRKEILKNLSKLLSTGIPLISKRLHDELDQVTGPGYLWGFLKDNWKELEEAGITELHVLERFVRRRVAFQFGRLIPGSSDPIELEIVEGAEFYIYPAVGNELRLGEIIKHKKTGRFHVVLTPHCYLTVQKGDEEPRAEYILTVKTVLAEEVIKAQKSQWGKTKATKLNQLRRYIQSPSELARPKGRYWFLPGFLNFPDSCCDFQQLESMSYKEVYEKFERVAVLDIPFAEAMQSCFTSFYFDVGLPTLNSERYQHLIP